MMKSTKLFRKNLLARLLLLMAGTQLFGQAENATVTSGLGPPSHSASFAHAVVIGKSSPFWRGKYMVRREREITSEQPNVVVYDQDGKLFFEAKVWFPDAVRVNISDVAVTPAGNVVASGYALSRDGSVARFIAKTDLAGTVTQVIRTNPFIPARICALDEDTVWSFGQELEKEEAGQDYKTLRNYSFTGGLLHAYVQRRSFKILPAPASEAGWLAPQLRCSGSKVAVYVPLAKEYLQLNVVHNTLDRFPVDDREMGDLGVTGFALTDSGHVYASLDERSVSLQGLQGWRGLFELKLNAAARQVQWVPVPSTLTRNADPKQPGNFYRLLGSDGTNLIYAETGATGYRWARPVIEKAVAAVGVK